MNNKLKVILIVFFIFLINTTQAQAIDHNYVSLTVTPGEELPRTTSFTGAYKPLFAAVDASGTAASWVIPRHIDFGAINPGDKIVKDYTISVPSNQRPGYYELIWGFSCRYTDGTTCTVTSDTVIQITVKAAPAPTATESNYISLTLKPGEEQSEYLKFTAPYGSSYAWADASGDSAYWATPRHIDFGLVDKGMSTSKYYTIKVPEDQYPGTYEIIWTWGCKYVSGETCSVTGETVVQITVEANPVPTFTSYIPPYTPTPESSTAPVIIGFIFILVLFIVWISIVAWVAGDARKRGTGATMWGILTFFLGFLGLLVYLISRPKGNLVSCGFCGKQKLETLNQCPHCKNTTTPAPTPAPMRPRTIAYPAVPQKPEVAVDESKGLKEKLSKINQLLDKLDEMLAQGEITESKYRELSEKYKAESDSLKNRIAEKELLDEVGLKK
ncbi:MAG: hypothetical protein O8C64_10615 [Candidatus Methanoperedens sp.]|nr:hypothetical protein [Candidatus Methanoperedens sp.]MCZ7404871.1 hypothetical protein [Candidatus Methanoperedens sp.]